jgi:beta-glucuronidase
MKTYPLYPERRALPLDGTWNFAWLGDIDINTFTPSGITYDTLMAVPGVFDTCTDYFGMRGVGVYRKKVSFHTNPSAIYRLLVGGMGLYGRIWWDGREIGKYNLPYSSVNYHFTSEDGNEHELVIAVDNRFDKLNTPLFSPDFDFYGYGGIYRSIELQELPDCYLERIHITTLDISRGLVNIKIGIGGNIPPKLEFSLNFDHSKSVSFKKKVIDKEVSMDIEVPDFKVWSLDNPNLHTLTVSIENDTIIERFGIRSVSIVNRQIMLNGEAIWLRGVNRHESHPEFGPVQPPHLMLDDLCLLKDLGCNFVRCVHYPQDQAFLDICDEYGILVWHESLGWNNTKEDVVRPQFFNLQLKQTELMVKNSINHPSIILWGFMNECCSDTEEGKKLYRALSGVIKKENPSLLVTYASSRQENDICFEFADVIAMTMYPGWIENITWDRESREAIEAFIKQKADFANRPDLKNKPFIVAEIGVCGLYGCHDRAYAQWSEEYQADYFAEACRCIIENPRYAGLALWQMFDTRSYVNTGAVRSKPRGFNCAGLLDEYRRPKLAYNVVKKLYRNTKLQSSFCSRR